MQCREKLAESRKAYKYFQQRMNVLFIKMFNFQQNEERRKRFFGNNKVFALLKVETEHDHLRQDKDIIILW